MKKIIVSFLCALCMIAMTACGIQKTHNQSMKDTSVQSDTGSAENASGISTEVNVNTITTEGDNGSDGPGALSDEEIDAARGIAISYYADTVFKVNSMEYIEPGTNALAEGECNFMVNVSKDGIVQEADRIIMLNKVDGLWKVVNEGY